MYYNQFQNIELSALGFGMMRLPVKADKSVDVDRVCEMVDIAIAGGVNYFDTAYPYHGGMSEIAAGIALEKYPRESFYLASKYPGHQIAESYDPAAIFEEQLQKCRVDYFDFYLLHNVCENSMDVYSNPKWGIIDYFVEQKRLGRIRHLGFSSHSRPESLRAFLEKYADKMEFCQIQLNYLDWTLQNAEEKVQILNEFHMPIWVMEPLHGGRLANPGSENAEKLQTLRPDESAAAWGFRWLQSVPGVTMILSGMSDADQMRENIQTFANRRPLNVAEQSALADVADDLKNAVPCTACRYCCDSCPMGLDIPGLIAGYNDAKFQAGFTVPMYLDSLPEDKHPSACLGCGACASVCPQQIDIPQVMRDFNALIPTLPSWTAVCRERAEAAKRMKQ